MAVESWIALRLTRHLSAERVQALREGVTKTLSDVHAAARDNEKMVLQVNNIITSMDALRGVTLGDGQESFNAHPGGNEPAARVIACQEFLRWLTAGISCSSA